MPFTRLPVTEEIRLVLPQDSFAPDPAATLAYYKRGVVPGGPCTYKEVLDDVAVKAREIGAHTAYIQTLKGPDERSSCYRVEVVFYR